MILSWNEIKSRAINFSKEWENEVSEEAEAKSFIEAFFNIFGISRRRVATFEHRVKKLDNSEGYIDLLWKGTILIEMKSRGKDLDKAFKQAKEYIHGLKEYELPKYILVSDFYYFRLFDTEDNKTIIFTINELVNNVVHFGFIAGYIKHTYKEQDPVNIKAAEQMGKLHDRLKSIGYYGHPLEIYLVRILFCLFADDTNIFEDKQLQNFIEQKTNEDGSDLAAKLHELFQVLNTPPEKRFKNLDEQLNAFPYINGKLFEESLPTASFDAKMRKTLLECCHINWSKISPAIFGSMFQSVMNPVERRNIGAHYTSEINILKLIKPLFLDELWQEFEVIKTNKNKLIAFHKKLSRLKFLDPACGCGNFLVITYRELRLLEIEILKAIQQGQQVTNIEHLLLIDVDQFYGIEYEEFPCRIAEVALWLIDHQMNLLCLSEFGEYFVRIPLKKAATIINRNALQVDWQSLLNKENVLTISADFTNIIKVEEPVEHYQKLNVYTKDYIETSEDIINKQQKPLISFDYIIGNPPFIGSKLMKKNQRDDILKQFENAQGSGVLDYVTGWYIKAAKYIQNTKIKVGFVSTNSIVQGEQTAILWEQMLNKYNIKIHFAHRTFKWTNEAKGNAAVYCVIIGFANYDIINKTIFDYTDIKGEAHKIKANNINPYLIDAKNLLITKRSAPICKVPKMNFGNMPLDGGHFLLTDKEKTDLLNKEPNAEKYIKPILSAKEFLNKINRWCLWLVDIEPSELKQLPEVLKRVHLIKEFRIKSVRPTTSKMATFPTLFGENRQPNNQFLLIPRVSSENRKYIPISFFDKNFIVSDTCLFIENANLFHFGILTSTMHIAWVKSVCGRLKSDFRYSKDIVYNNYLWPENPTEKQIKVIEERSQKLLDARAEFPNSSLADLYNPLTMPAILAKAHIELDKAVDLAYRSQPFTSEAKRMEFLFHLYEKYTSGLFTKTQTKIKK